MKRIAIACLLLLLSAPVRAAWVSGTVSALDVSPSDGRLIAVVVFTDDKGLQVKDSFIDEPSAMRARIVNELQKRNASDAAKVDLHVGAVIVASAVVPVVPTADDAAVSAFQTTVLGWQAAKAKLVLGLAIQSDVDTAIAAITTAYKAGTAPQLPRFDVLLAVLFRGLP